MKSVVEQEFWDRSYDHIPFSPLNDNNSIINLIFKYIKNTKDMSVFEIGCFPGGYLEKIAHKGMTVSGIDLTPRMNEMVKWLNTRHIKIGDFFIDDVLKFQHKKKYNIVCSFGFIEHYVEWEKVIELHSNLLKENGYLIITCPNFNSPITWLFHRIFDWENLNKHVVNSMNQDLWGSYLEDKNFEIIYKGSFGQPQFWFDTTIKNQFLNKMRSNITAWLNRNSINFPILNKVRSINGIIARKK